MGWIDYIFMRVSCTAILLMLLGTMTEGQTLQEWTKQKQLQTAYKVNQIVALKGYLEVAKKGYEIARVGWNLVDLAQDGEFTLHRDYFASLTKVHPVVANDPTGKHIVWIYVQIQKEVDWMGTYLKSSGKWGTSDTSHILGFNQTCLTESGNMVRELDDLLTSHTYDMEDGERLELIAKLDKEITRLYSALKLYNGQIRQLNLHRSKDDLEMNQIKALYND